MKQRTPEETYGPALEKAIMQSLDPWLVALRSDTKYTSLTDSSSQIEVRFWGKDYVVRYPEISVEEVETGQEPPIAVKILVLHYLINADGVRLADSWVAFRELPGGRVYDAARPLPGGRGVPCLGQCTLRRSGEPLPAHGGPGRAGRNAGRATDKSWDRSVRLSGEKLPR